jgi:formate hydrogenlyase subunit 6/NADH:ubiquinone oxidoreductase subunit I
MEVFVHIRVCPKIYGFFEIFGFYLRTFISNKALASPLLFSLLLMVNAMSEESYEGIPRNQIPWDPKIDSQKCVSCGKCVDFCHMHAFKTVEVNGKKQTEVIPNRCVVFCRGCEDICPAGAISHPNEEKTEALIKELKSGKQ